jgi:hypothetical protein
MKIRITKAEVPVEWLADHIYKMKAANPILDIEVASLERFLPFPSAISAKHRDSKTCHTLYNSPLRSFFLSVPGKACWPEQSLHDLRKQNRFQDYQFCLQRPSSR